MPQIHIVVGNRLTQYGGAATAFRALSDATADTLFSAFQRHPAYFTPRNVKVAKLDHFRKRYSVALRDFNTAGVVSAHLGTPLSRMTEGYYQVHEEQVYVNADRVKECCDALDDLIAVVD